MCAGISPARRGSPPGPAGSLRSWQQMPGGFLSTSKQALGGLPLVQKPFLHRQSGLGTEAQGMDAHQNLNHKRHLPHGGRMCQPGSRTSLRDCSAIPSTATNAHCINQRASLACRPPPGLLGDAASPRSWEQTGDGRHGCGSGTKARASRLLGAGGSVLGLSKRTDKQQTPRQRQPLTKKLQNSANHFRRLDSPSFCFRK